MSQAQKKEHFLCSKTHSQVFILLNQPATTSINPIYFLYFNLLPSRSTITTPTAITPSTFTPLHLTQRPQSHRN